jgi:hypothetical protein
MDNLFMSGQLRGALGAPGNNRKGQLNPGPVQATAPVRTGAAVKTGQQLGAAALQLVRGTFLRNLGLAVSHVSRLAGTGTADIAASSGGLPAAPSVTGWDGVPLDKYGV